MFLRGIPCSVTKQAHKTKRVVAGRVSLRCKEEPENPRQVMASQSRPYLRRTRETLHPKTIHLKAQILAWRQKSLTRILCIQAVHHMSGYENFTSRTRIAVPACKYHITPISNGGLRNKPFNQQQPGMPMVWGTSCYEGRRAPPLAKV